MIRKMRTAALACCLAAVACGGGAGVGASGPPADAAIRGGGAAASPDAAPPDAAPPVIRYVDVSDELPASYPTGRRTQGTGSGAAIGDLDGDGRNDLVLGRCDTPDGGPSLWLRADPTRAGFAFTPEPLPGVAGTCSNSVALGDYDRDGDLDVFLGMADEDMLLANDGAGHFTDVTAAAGVAGSHLQVGSAAVWADLNADGLLDLYVGNHDATDEIGPEEDPLKVSYLYVNRGDGTFSSVAAEARAESRGIAQAVLAADLNADGVLDLWVANDEFTINGSGGISYLKHDVLLRASRLNSEGVPVYRDVCTAACYGRRASMGLAMAYLDDDLYPEVFVSDYGDTHVMRLQDGAYQDVADELGLSTGLTHDYYPLISWGSRFLDADRDGALELALVGGAFFDPMPDCEGMGHQNVYLQSAPGETRFVDVSREVGWPRMVSCPPVSEPHRGRGLFSGDLDGDGDDDLVEGAMINPYRVFRNDSTGGHFLRVRPRGRVSAPMPAGALLEVTHDDGHVQREQLYAGGDTRGQSDAVLELGLGPSPDVREVWLRWPSGYSQRLDGQPGFALDRELTIVEPEWLTLSARVVRGGDPPPVLVYRPMDATGRPLNNKAAAGQITIARSDRKPVELIAADDGSCRATLARGTATFVVLTVSVDGVALPPRPIVTFR